MLIRLQSSLSIPRAFVQPISNEDTNLPLNTFHQDGIRTVLCLVFTKPSTFFLGGWNVFLSLNLMGRNFQPAERSTCCIHTGIQWQQLQRKKKGTLSFSNLFPLDEASVSSLRATNVKSEPWLDRIASALSCTQRSVEPRWLLWRSRGYK